MIIATAITFLVAALTLVTFALGLRLCWIGVRGSMIGNHPYCRRCGFDLIGHNTWPAQCPECGEDLTGEDAIVIGRREPSRGHLLAGLALLVVSTSPFTLSGCFGAG